MRIMTTGKKRIIGEKTKLARRGPAKRWVGAALSAALIAQSVWMVPYAQAAERLSTSAAEVTIAASQQQAQVRLVAEEPITAGANLRTYEFSAMRNGKSIRTTVSVIVVDLNNPHVDLSVMNGLNDNLHSRQNVLGMAKETGAVAGVNGDFFNWTQNPTPPIGPVIDDGVWRASPLFAEGYYMFGLSKDRRPVIDYYTFEGRVTAPDGASYPIRGMNRMATWSNHQLSHIDSIFIYTPDWGILDRGNEPNYTPSEILVTEDGEVVDMVFGKTFDFLVPEGHLILRVNREAAQFFQNHVKIGDRLTIDYDLKPTGADNPVRGKDLKMLIGGGTLLVNGGKPAAFTVSPSVVGGTQARSRTAVGYSQDGRYVYLMAADNAGASQGMTLQELQDFMVLIGVWKGLNLDGGGSTTLVSRPLGETSPRLVNTPEFGGMRAVANGIGVYTHAPQGELRGLLLDGPSFIFINELATYTAKAYDTYYNPIDPATLPIVYTVTDEGGKDDGNQLTPTRRGTATVTATSGKVKQTMTVQVVGRQDLARLEIASSSQVFSKGQTYTISVYATTIDGRKRQVPSESIEWEFLGFTGEMNGNKLTVLEQTDESTNRLIARYDGFGVMLTVPAGVDRLWADFDTRTKDISFRSTPAETTGWAQVLNDVPGTDPANHVLHLAYDFYKGDPVTKAAYAELNGGEGYVIEGKPIAMKLKLMGDNSFNWVRAEFRDADGKQHLVDIARGVNWYGFKDIEVDLTQYDMAYPITLKRLYVANPAERQDERAKFGAVAFDDISFFYRGEVPPIEKPKVELTIGRNVLTVNGEERVLDQAPVNINGTTLIPIRFIVEALNGEVFWDPQQYKVTLLKNDHLIEMWIGDPDLVIDGVRTTSRVAPYLLNNRTMVPLRLIAEAFGWKVDWNNAEQKVTLQ
jgi:hypothetical protein